MLCILKESIAQLGHLLNGNTKYNNKIPLKASLVLLCTKNTALYDMSRDKYSTQLCLVVYMYLSLNMFPHTVFSVYTHGGA